MFKFSDIKSLVQLFDLRGVHLYHSCQYQDFCSYLTAGGIPSRLRLEHEQLPVTEFETDNRDKENNVWDKVFLNLEDFGKNFADGKTWVPNVYGPILFRLKPKALALASDVAICLRSASTCDFDRENESLNSIDAVDNLFFNPKNHSYSTAALKFRYSLQKTFGPKAEAIEMSCTYPKGCLPFDQLIDIVIDPYLLDEQELVNLVLNQVQIMGLDYPVVKRNPKIDHNLYQLFISGKNNNEYLAPTTLAKTSKSKYFNQWAQKSWIAVGCCRVITIAS